MLNTNLSNINFTSPARLTLVKKSDNVGDCDQLNGVKHALLHRFSSAEKFLGIKEIEIDRFTYHDLESSSIVMLVGLEGAKSLIRTLTENQDEELSSSLVVYLTHQWYPEIEQLIKRDSTSRGADIVVLPSHIATPDIIGKFDRTSSTLAITTGVCHNMQVKDLIDQYNLFQNQLFTHQECAVGIVLAGDAPDTSNTWFYFTPEEAEELALSIAEYLRNSGGVDELLVTNGPRTGKFIASGELDTQAHRDGQRDAVTKKFMEVLSNQGISAKLFDFQYGAPSHFKAILGALEHHTEHSEIFMPGESLSMISQGLDVLKKTSMIIYMNRAMNAEHEKYVDEVHQMGQASILTQDKRIIPAIIQDQHTRQTSYQPAREQVAQTIDDMLHLKV